MTSHRSLAVALVAGFLAGALPDATAFVWPFFFAGRAVELGIVPGSPDSIGAFRMIFGAIRVGMVLGLVPVLFGWTSFARAARREPEAPTHVRNAAVVGTLIAALAWLFAAADAAEWALGVQHAATSVARGLAQSALAPVGGMALIRSPRGRSPALASVGLFVVSGFVDLASQHAFDDSVGADGADPTMLTGYAFLAAAMLSGFSGWVLLALALIRARARDGRLW